jgi:hypothetical protein
MATKKRNPFESSEKDKAMDKKLKIKEGSKKDEMMDNAKYKGGKSMDKRPKAKKK